MWAPVNCRNSVRRMGMLLWARLGNCPFCTRRAFQATFVSWCLTAFLQWLPGSGPLLTVSGATACALTALWVGHLFVFALKLSASVQEGSSAESERPFSRRYVLSFGRAFVGAVVAASVPSFGLAQCNEVATRCEAIASNCHANCSRSAHREEAARACYQECHSNYLACKADARCT
jgi:hypothetical protein